MVQPTGILLIHPIPALLDGLHYWVRSRFELFNLYPCITHDDAVKIIENNAHIKLLIGDFNLKDKATEDFLKHIRKHYPDIKALCLVPLSNPAMANHLIKAGYENLIAETCTQTKLLMAIDVILNNGYYLDFEIKAIAATADAELSIITKKERQILMQLMEGVSRKTIAEKLFITPDTLKSHIKSMRKKLGVHNDSELVIKGRQFTGMFV